MKVVKELSRKVSQLTGDTIALKNEIGSNATQPTPNVSHATTGPNQAPLSPDIVVLEHGQFSPNPDHHTDEHDQSNLSESNTIDDNVPSDNPHLSLNSQAPTTQLHQLRHTLNNSQQ